MYHLRSRRLLQRKLIVAQRLVYVELQNVQRDVVFFLRPVDFDPRREVDAVVLLIVCVLGVSYQIALLVVNELAMGPQVDAAENDLAREKSLGLIFFADDD